MLAHTRSSISIPSASRACWWRSSYSPGTITGGGNTGTEAGGVDASGTAVVSHNVITGNVADQRGGGVTARDTVVVHNNRITNNTSPNRVGVNGRHDSVIINNYIADSGVGIWDFSFSGGADIFNNTLVDNPNYGMAITFGALRKV